MIGLELGGRYEIIERIGGGGMALVYKAYDTLLQRKVAVKILREQFVHDEEFIQRFRREARSAASLSHPNVVSIYDVGQDEDTHYIVMECIEGHTLNDIIKQRAPLQVEEAVHIASQICDALDHAHHNGIIHRDIKPHNILIGKNGRVKVTDFGIARAVTSSDITQTGAVLGSVHYFSPEHAKGVSQGEKSDIYSLGVVLYQMLTNRLPFAGESPIGVALKHLQEHFEEPRAINPLIPQSVENIILKAMRKQPEERYASAKEMLEDLETCMQPNRLNESKSEFIDLDDEDRTIIMPAIRGTAFMEQQDKTPRSRIADSLEDKPVRKSWWLKPLIWAVVVIIVLFAAWQGVKAFIGAFEVPEVLVPSVVGEPYEQAVQELSDLGLLVEKVEGEFSNQYEKGHVIHQSKSDIMVKVNSTIKLTPSLGPKEIDMRNVIGLDVNQAKNELIDFGFTVDRIEIVEGYDDKPIGEVIGQEPREGTLINPSEDRIRITVSQGPGTINMPNLIDKKEDVAKNMLERAGLVLAHTEHEKDYMIAKGHVIRQWPYEPNAPVSPGADITITISDGMPDDALQAEKTIRVNPAVEGKASTVMFLISDARGDERKWDDPREITETQNFRIGVVVAPHKNAVISVVVDDVVVDKQTYTYTEALLAKQGNSNSGSSSSGSNGNNLDNGNSESNENSGNDNGSGASVETEGMEAD